MRAVHGVSKLDQSDQLDGDFVNWRDRRLTEHQGSIAATRGLSLILGEAVLLCALALQTLLGAFIELALERSLLLVIGAESGRGCKKSLLCDAWRGARWDGAQSSPKDGAMWADHDGCEERATRG